MKVPKVTPRKAEVQAIADILESGEYADATAMAKALLATAYSLMLQRDWYIVAERNDGANILWGPFPTENMAIKAISPLGACGEVGVFKVRSVMDRALKIEDMEVSKDPNECSTCHHMKAAHEFPRRKGCVGRGCACQQFTN